MRRATVFLTALLLISLALPLLRAADRDWIAASNDFTNMALSVDMKHHPEEGTRQGLSKYDALGGTAHSGGRGYGAQRNRRGRYQAQERTLANEKQKEVAQDLEIIIRRLELQFNRAGFRARPRRSVPQCQRHRVSRNPTVAR